MCGAKLFKEAKNRASALYFSKKKKNNNNNNNLLLLLLNKRGCFLIFKFTSIKVKSKKRILSTNTKCTA